MTNESDTKLRTVREVAQALEDRLGIDGITDLLEPILREWAEAIIRACEDAHGREYATGVRPKLGMER